MTAAWIPLYAALAGVFVVLAFGRAICRVIRSGIEQPDEPDRRRDVSARPCWPEVVMGNRLEREVAPGIDLQDGQP